jgi:uncharacterized protein YqjF (DUF2071 family)
MNRPTRPGHPKHVSVPISPDAVFLTAEWRHLVMLNYEVNASLLLPFVPAGTELDRFDGRVFVSLIGFRFLQARLFGFVPIPMHSNFEEVNLRFYVRRSAEGEVRRGVVFIRELVPRRAIAFVARTFYNEKYKALPMTHEFRPLADNRLRVAYRWQNEKKWSGISLETEGDPELPAEGSIEQFITEHYWGYAAQPDGGCVEYRVTHPPWKVWQVRHSAFGGDATMFYGEPFTAAISGPLQSAFLAEGSAVTVMRGQRI